MTIDRKFFVSALGLLVALGGVGCGDDDRPAVDAGPADSGPPGMCENADDMTKIVRDDFGPMMNQDVSGVAAGCALGPCVSMTGMEQATCITTCIVTATTLSAGCASCVTMSVGCTFQNCIMECVPDPTTTECVACRCGANTAMVNCFDVYEACSGLTPTTDYCM